MFAMVASSTTMSCAMQISARAHPRWRCPEAVGRCGGAAVRWRSSGLLGERGVAAGGGREDDLVDDALDQVAGDGVAEDERAVQEDPRQGGAEQGEVDTGRAARRAPRRVGRSRCMTAILGARNLVAELRGRTPRRSGAR